MTEPADLGRALLDLALGIVEPLEIAGSDPQAALALIELTGWDLGAVAGLDPGEFSTTVTAIAGAVAGVRQTIESLGADGPDIETVASVLISVAEAGAALYSFGESWSHPADLPQELPGLFLEDLVGHLAVLAAGRYHPALRSVLDLLGILSYVDAPAIQLANGHVIRPSGLRPRLDLTVLGTLFTDPPTALLGRFGLATQGRLPAPDAADKLFPALAAVLRDAGLKAWHGDPGTGAPLTQDQQDVLSHMLRIVWAHSVPALEGGIAVLDVALALRDDGTTRELLIIPSGTLGVGHSTATWSASATLTGAVGGIVLRADGVRFVGAGTSLKLEATVARPVGPTPLARFGSPTATRFEVGGVAVTVTEEFPSPAIDLGVSVEVNHIVLAVAAGDGDGFLSKVLPAKPIVATADLGLDWTLRKGLKVHGSGSLEITIAQHLVLGPIVLDEIVLAAGFTQAGLTAQVGIGATLSIGPLVASVQNVGVRATLSSGSGSMVTVGFKPPNGIGFTINAGPVKGGGLVSIDELAHQYAGILQLDIASVVTVTAIGLLTTRMPDGSDGFSLLVLITAEFPPIQLGYGFALTGLGGLVGIHRTFNVEALQAGVRTGAVGAILFPKDPVANANQLIATLKSVFPPAAGRYVFGPMVKLGWGPKGLLSFELGLVLELPSPLRLAIVGKILVVLPTKEEAVAQLRLDVLGIVDFARGEVAIDASLIDSRIAVFTITGDMALRVNWKATPGFAVAVGGFHPKFTPPPGFPSLQRLAISLATSDNPRIRLETYFAITSNSIQFGGGLDLAVTAGPFAARAFAGLDALIQFNPFHFVITLSMGIDVTWNGSPLLHAQLEGLLEGPSPWHASGFAEFHVLFLSGRLAVNVTAGPGVTETPIRIMLGDELTKALLADDAWLNRAAARGRDRCESAFR